VKPRRALPEHGLGSTRVRVAAVQLEPVIGDVAANLESCERLVDAAAQQDADWIVLPAVFTTGMAFRDELAGAALAPDGAATALMRELASRHGATVGGSFLCRDPDGEVRNAFLLFDGDGTLLGRHDKDLPTMWENAFYVAGSDDGLLEAGQLAVGVALCWELMRAPTARRLRGRVDLVVGGSCWWSLPLWPPASVTRRWEAANARTAALVAERFARLVGAPVVHAAHMGSVSCPLPGTPLRYRGEYQGGAVVADGHGRVLARRTREEGPGLAVAEIEPGSVPPLDAIPDRFWLHDRGPVPAALWHHQRAHGRLWYRRHTRGKAPLEVERTPLETPGMGR